MKRLRMNRKRYAAIVTACEALLSGEEGEGDWPSNVSAADLHAASEWAKRKRDAFDEDERGVFDENGERKPLPGENPICPRCASDEVIRVRNYGRPVSDEWQCLNCKRRWDRSPAS